MAKRNMTSAELKQLRREVVINSLDVSDYRNTLNIDAEKTKRFFDRYIESLIEYAVADGVDISSVDMYDVIVDYDNDNALIDFYRQIAPSDNDMFLNCDKETIRESEIAEEYITFDFQFSLLF